MRPGSSTLDNLKAQRLAAGLSITSLAKKASVSDWTIQNLENGGNDEAHVIVRIQDALGVSAGTLGKRSF